MAAVPSLNIASQCPLCGGDNRCAMEIERATGETQSPCWCVTESFPPDLIDAVPAEAKGQACICLDCLRAASQRATAARPAP